MDLAQFVVASLVLLLIFSFLAYHDRSSENEKDRGEIDSLKSDLIQARSERDRWQQLHAEANNEANKTLSRFVEAAVFNWNVQYTRPEIEGSVEPPPPDQIDPEDVP